MLCDEQKVQVVPEKEFKAVYVEIGETCGIKLSFAGLTGW